MPFLQGLFPAPEAVHALMHCGSLAVEPPLMEGRVHPWTQEALLAPTVFPAA